VRWADELMTNSSVQMGQRLGNSQSH
jgi:hypothetical protein